MTEWRTAQQFTNKSDLGRTKKNWGILTESRKTELRETRGGLGQKNHHRRKVEKKV